MKKTILILSIASLLLFFELNINGQESDVIDTHEQTVENINISMVDYFKNLKTYAPYNNIGSCSYVSLIQYLSYYDTFLNDDIIPEQYERNQGNSTTIMDAKNESPGVYRNYNYISANGILNEIELYSDYDFQMKLMEVMVESNVRTDVESLYSISSNDYDILMDYIFPNTEVQKYNRVLNYESETSSAKPNDEEVKEYFDDYVKNILDSGHPAIISIVNYNPLYDSFSGPHSIVAYYYDDEGIHAHYGNGADTTDKVIGSRTDVEECIWEVTYFDFSNVIETHSNNYEINDSQYCGCGYLYHTHDYQNNYSQLSDLTHIATCECGNIKEIKHTKFLEGTNIKCNDCTWNKQINEIINTNNLLIDVFNYEDFSEFTVDITVDNQMSEWFRVISIKQSTQFNISVMTTNNIKLVLFKENNGEFENVLDTNINVDTNTLYEFENGTYIIGYYDLFNDNEISISMTREISEFSSNYFITDPDKATLCGSHITLAEENIDIDQRSYRQKNILEGFTRIIYLLNGESRQDFYWYSSNENVATVSNFGTVLGRNVSKNENVKIMAINKNDPSIVYMSNFTIINDTLDYTNNPIDIHLLMIVNEGDENYIDLSNLNVPINMLQNYSWYCSNYDYATVNYYGKMTIKENASGKTVLITGSYRYNNRVKIKITVNIN